MRFTIRDLLWLTVVVALGLTWLLDRRQMQSVMDAQTAELDLMTALVSGNRAQVDDALGRCLVAGSPAKSRQAILDLGTVIPDYRVNPPAETMYQLPCTGRSFIVLVVVRGDVIVSAGTGTIHDTVNKRHSP